MGIRPAIVHIDKSKCVDITNSDEAKRFVEARARAGAELARAFMPVRTGHEQEQVVSGPAEETPEGASAPFGSESSIWHLIEYGSIHNPPYAPFRRAAEALGAVWKETGP